MILKYHYVRQTSLEVVKKSRNVKLDPDCLDAFAQSILAQAVKAEYHWEAPFHFLGKGEGLLNYIFTVDAINFGSGFSPEIKAQTGQGIYAFVAEGLKKALLAGCDLSPSWALSITQQDLSRLFALQAPELLSMFATSLRELGHWVCAKYEGKYANLIEDLPGEKRADALISRLLEHCPCWRDEGKYEGMRVAFYKRAQILAHDLFLGFQGQGWGAFDDIQNLTTFADNMIPHVLHTEGIIQYSEDLERRIAAGEFLVSYSPEEVEIRAASILAVDRLSQQFPRDEGLFPAMLDLYLWNHGHDERYRRSRKHLAKSYFY